MFCIPLLSVLLCQLQASLKSSKDKPSRVVKYWYTTLKQLMDLRSTALITICSSSSSRIGLTLVCLYLPYCTLIICKDSDLFSLTAICVDFYMICSSISILCRPVVVRKFFLTVSNVQLENHSANVTMTKFVVKSPPMLY